MHEVDEAVVAAMCAVCRKPIFKAADARVVSGQLVHKTCSKD